MINGFEDIQKVSKDSMDQAMKSFGSLSKGLQAIATEYADFSKKSLEDGTAAFEKVIAAKSPDKALEAQSEFVKTSYSGMVSEMTKINEMYVDLAREAFSSYETALGKATK
ncbi:phasin family protein [Breoghania sp. L-A4]|uniref:phasin family protein n=1 Tax=Breoghania sp. L-A4 TaxID=2304600 RepID=UPI000E359387|nr:phasin family protein [Breoghania sp. L-A4]AXS40889.1 phasin family protein [Breoghania sp. L-A4]